jgi:hypothetical protein
MLQRLEVNINPHVPEGRLASILGVEQKFKQETSDEAGDSSLPKPHFCVLFLSAKMAEITNKRVKSFFGNLILFAICTSTFSKLCINLYNGKYKSVQ